MTLKADNKDNRRFIRTTITPDEINELPLGAFDGKIEVVDDLRHLPAIFKEIKQHNVIGFDTETRPSFHRGQHYKVALLQLAVEHKAFIIRLHHTGISDEILEFCTNKKILKVGIGVRDDVKALQKIRNFDPENFIEITTIARQAGLEVESVKKLSALLLGFRISKSAQTSNWEAETLNEKQITYAATDAWVCLEIYKRLVQ